MRGLTRQERKLVVAARHGRRLECGGTEVVRADVIRDLLLGRYGTVDPRGVRLRGGLIEGQLDLEGVLSTAGLNLTDCRLTRPVVARDARFPWFELEGCHVPALLADRLTVTGGLFLRYGFTAVSLEQRTVRLPGARIGGNVECDGAMLTSAHGPALHAEDIRIERNLFLRNGFSVISDSSLAAVMLGGASVGGGLDLSGSKLCNTSGPALSAHGLHVAGQLKIGSGTSFRGRSSSVTVDLSGSRLGGLSWRGSSAENSDPSGAKVSLEHVSAGWVEVEETFLCGDNAERDCGAGELLISGLSYRSLAAEGADWQRWLHWIRSHTRAYTAHS
ncbi:hypothetical protein [Lentzea sp. NPDC059081]|uniref:hypothetical protein n=1 Tax=Lentzea sp. NPDC059081 TaxID=3346719 RepID=UPI003676625F